MHYNNAQFNFEIGKTEIFFMKNCKQRQKEWQKQTVVRLL
jgi:hypothetical protein